MKSVTSLEDTPLLVSMAIPRTGNDELPGRYEPDRQVWVIDEADEAIPIVEKAKNLAELVTKTKVRQEQDDPGAIACLEMTTKTEAQRERDDVSGNSLLTLLHLSTKTAQQMERDDR